MRRIWFYLSLSPAFIVCLLPFSFLSVFAVACRFFFATSFSLSVPPAPLLPVPPVFFGARSRHSGLQRA
jgi:hypothetical protein